MSFLGLKPPLLIDGGMATSLGAIGVPMHPTLWSGGAVIDSPQRVTEVHKDFVQAGANVLISASYQLTPQALRTLGYRKDQICELLLRTVDCAERACVDRRRTIIAGGIGPYGAHLCDGSEYRGQYSLNLADLLEFHRERFEVLSASRCDVVLFETVPCLDEVRAIVELTSHASKPLWVSLCCRSESELASGESLAAAAHLLHDATPVNALGVNCVSPRNVAAHVRILKAATTKPIFVYPNLGQTWDAEKREWQGHVDERAFLEFVREWLDLGVAGIGGCCGVGSKLIRKIGEQISLQRSSTQ